MMTDTPVLNAHHKSEYPPMHTAEHILNKTMVDMFGCERSKNAHIEQNDENKKLQKWKQVDFMIKGK